MALRPQKSWGKTSATRTHHSYSQFVSTKDQNDFYLFNPVLTFSFFSPSSNITNLVSFLSPKYRQTISLIETTATLTRLLLRMNEWIMYNKKKSSTHMTFLLHHTWSKAWCTPLFSTRCLMNLSARLKILHLYSYPCRSTWFIFVASPHFFLHQTKAFTS